MHYSQRTIVSLALFALVSIGALVTLGGDTGTTGAPALTPDPTGPLSALAQPQATEAIEVVASDPTHTPEQIFSAPLAPTPAPELPADPESAPALPRARAGLTTDDGVNLREGPGTDFRILSQLPAGAPAEVLAEQDGWYHVFTPWESSGWVAAGYFQLTPAPAEPVQPQRLGTASAVGRVRLRSGPGTEYPGIQTLNDGAVLEVLSLEGSWYSVRASSGAVGWVAAEYAALDWIPDVYGGSDTPPSTSESDVVRIAEGYLGTRYVWGGSFPGGFDCSGLTWYVYRQVGVRIPAGSVQQFDTGYGRYVRSLDSLAPGDLVFFERTADGPDITHVGIYAGGGKMIAARSERLGVRYVSLIEPFWNSRFVGGIRPYR